MAYKAIPLETRSCKGCGVQFQTTDPRKWFHKRGCGRAKVEKQTNEWYLANRPNFPTEPCLACGAPVVQYRTRRYEGELRYCNKRCEGNSRMIATWPPVDTQGAQCVVRSKCVDCRSMVRYATKRCMSCTDKFRNQARRLAFRLKWLLPRSCSICATSFKSWGKDKRCPHCKTLRDRVVAAGDKSVTLLNVYTLDEGVCSICSGVTRHPDDWKIPGKREPDLPSIDHIKPISKGGTHDWTNVALACLRCNILKGNRAPSEGRAVEVLVSERGSVPSAEFVNLLYGVGSTNG